MDTFKVKKICRSQEERRRGLIGDPLSDGEVCLFVFDAAGLHSFWNKGVEHGVWLSAIEGGVVVDTAYMEQDDATPVKVDGGRVVAETLVELEVGAGVAEWKGWLFVA